MRVHQAGCGGGIGPIASAPAGSRGARRRRATLSLNSGPAGPERQVGRASCVNTGKLFAAPRWPARRSSASSSAPSAASSLAAGRPPARGCSRCFSMVLDASRCFATLRDAPLRTPQARPFRGRGFDGERRVVSLFFLAKAAPASIKAAPKRRQSHVRAARAAALRSRPLETSKDRTEHRAHTRARARTRTHARTPRTRRGRRALGGRDRRREVGGVGASGH